MKIALVHDDLIQFGGAERLLLAVSEIWPDAPIYTSVITKKWKKVLNERNIKYKTSFMQNLPFVTKLNRYYSPFLLHAIAFEGFDFSEFDVVLSFSTRYAHGVITKPTTRHICYMNSPGRMLWEADNYFKDEEYGLLSPMKRIAKPFLAPFLSHLRTWDYVAAQHVDYFIANSKTPQKRIEKYYGRKSVVVYPPVDYAMLSKVKSIKGDYYLILTRLVSWKKIEIAIKACLDLNLPLVVAGEGPDEPRLKELAGKGVRFVGYVSEKYKKDLLAKCKAVIVTQKEDFGIVPLEAMSVGKPVIAFRGGGVLETVVEGKTGEFFSKQTEDFLKDILMYFDSTKYSEYDCRAQARKFEKKVFQLQLKKFVSVLKYEPRKAL